MTTAQNNTSTSANTHQGGLVPRLRFPEFEGEWNAHRIGDVCNVYQPETIPSSKFDLNGKYRVYGAGGLIGRYTAYNHKETEVIIGCRGICGNVSMTEPMSWITGNAMVLQPSAPELQKRFLYHLLTATDLSPIISGSAQPQITRAALAPFRITTSSLPEQQKIADCLSSLDELIAAEDQKLATLKVHKKGLMQELFPREGESVPQIRFPEFEGTGEWEVKKLGDVGEIITGSTPSTANREYYDGEHLFVSPADISDIRFVNKTKTTLSSLGFAQTRLVKPGSTLFVCIGSTIGKTAQVQQTVATNQQINSISPHNEFSPDFIYYLSSLHSEGIADLAGIQAVPIVNKTLFSSYLVSTPHLPEQQKIAAVLSSLDDRISAQAERIEALRVHKKGLMQGLFPVMEG